jgi:hypothetical protein
VVSTRGIGPEPHGMWQIPKGCTPGYTGPGVGELRLWLQRTQPFEMRSIPTCFAQCHSPLPAGGCPGRLQTPKSIPTFGGLHSILFVTLRAVESDRFDALLGPSPSSPVARVYEGRGTRDTRAQRIIEQPKHTTMANILPNAPSARREPPRLPNSKARWGQSPRIWWCCSVT